MTNEVIKTTQMKMLAAGIHGAMINHWDKTNLQQEMIDLHAIAGGHVLPNPAFYPDVSSKADAEARIYEVAKKLKDIENMDASNADLSLLSDEWQAAWDVCAQCRQLLFCLKLVAYALNDARAKREVGALTEKIARAEDSHSASECKDIGSAVLRSCLTLLAEYSKISEEELLKDLSLPLRTEKEAAKGARSGGKSGARAGAIEYNTKILQDGGTGTRKPGGGRKPKYDVNGLQCAALLAMGRKFKEGGKDGRKPPATFAVYADMVIRKKGGFPTSDCPFVYPDSGDGRSCDYVRCKLLERFKTYCRRLAPPLTLDEALPLDAPE